MSNDINFENIIASGSNKSIYSDNFTVKVDAEIPQEFNGRKLFYRFNYENVYSNIGITSTLPSNNPRKYNIAFCSCSNYPAGFFNAYKEIAENNDIDLVLHLGDYIYEYGKNVYPSEGSEEMGRVVEPHHEIISLDDYRKRYALYRSDEDLQNLSITRFKTYDCCLG